MVKGVGLGYLGRRIVLRGGAAVAGAHFIRARGVAVGCGADGHVAIETGVAGYWLLAEELGRGGGGIRITIGHAYSVIERGYGNS